jgi:probable rRNA maturation factor
MEKKVSVINKTKGKLPSLPFVLLKNDILDKNYSLSIAFVEAKKSREINKAYRNKNKPTNILSFALQKNEGEIILCPAVIRKQTKSFSKTFRLLTGFLVIHGMLHLKGMKHGSIMERAEKKYDQKYFSGNRRRLIDDESHSGRVFKRRKKS